jgi:SNF2 family DNA or RNA helicase
MKNWEPKAYQLEAVKWLLQNSNAGLFFDPGLGKTSCVLAALTVLKSKGMLRRALVVAPLRVATTVWPDERMKWLDFHGLTVEVLHGPRKDKRLHTTTADVVVITPEGLDWMTRIGGFATLNADVLVVDESSYFRHTTSQRFKNLKAQLSRFDRRIILTGTPNPRGYEDLFSQAYILDMGGALGRYITHYRMKYFDNFGHNYPDWRLRSGADKEINDKLRPLVLRGDAVDHLEMPHLIHNTVKVPIGDEAMATYAELERNFYLALGNDEVITPNAAVLATKLRQVANGFVYTASHAAAPVHDAKLKALSGLIDELQGQPVLVLYEFIEDLTRIKKELGFNLPYIGGGVSTTVAKTHMADFNAGKLPILLAHPKSAGHGINLQDCAQHIIWFGPTWDLEWHIQATARVWRQGNPHERVFVHTLVAADTIDETVAKVLTNKNKTQADFLYAIKERPQAVVVAES